MMCRGIERERKKKEAEKKKFLFEAQRVVEGQGEERYTHLIKGFA